MIRGCYGLRWEEASLGILPGLRGESLVIAMDQHGISLSSGSTCKSGSPELTHVLIAMGKTARQARCSVRFSLSIATTDYDIDYCVTAMHRVLTEIEKTVLPWKKSHECAIWELTGHV